MAVATGIEISGNTIRCVVLQGSAKAPKLKKAFSESLVLEEEEEDTAQATARLVEEILKKNGVQTGNVVMALDGRQVYCREVVVPFTRNDQIKKTIKFEAEEFMPAAPVESMIIDYYKVAEIGGKSRILVCGVNKSLIAETIESSKSAGFTPRALDFDSACLANVGYAAGIFAPSVAEKTESDGEPPAHTAVLALDVAPDISRLVLVEDGQLRRTRTFKVALDTQNLSTETVRKIAREIKRTEASCSLKAPVSIVYITGPAYTVNLGIMLREALDIEVEFLNLETFTGDQAEGTQEKLLAGGSIALGAALKGLGFDKIGFDFRKDEFALHKAFDELKVGITCTACILFFMAFMLAYTFNVRLSQDRYALKKLREDARETFLRLLPGGPPLKARDAQAVLRSFNIALGKRKSGRLSDKVPDIISALDIFKEFGEAVYNSKADFSLTNITVSQSSVRVEGIIKEQRHDDEIRREILKRSRYLSFPDSDIKTRKDEIIVTQRYKVKVPGKK
jgi:Tfp pilus assembly PilM family ATPase